MRKYNNRLHEMLYLDFLDLEDQWTHIQYKLDYSNSLMMKAFVSLMHENINANEFVGVGGFLNPTSRKT